MADIPTELVIKAAKASSQHFEHCDAGKSWTDCGDCVRVYDRAHYALAAVLPEYEKQLRAERDALQSELAEVKAELDQVSVHKGVNCYWRGRAQTAETELAEARAAIERAQTVAEKWRAKLSAPESPESPHVNTAQEVRRGHIVRHIHMAAEADGEWLRDCKVTQSGRTDMGSWLIEWRMVGDDTVSGSLLCQPGTPIEIVQATIEETNDEH